MARPPKNSPPDTFTTAEIGQATLLGRRSVLFLNDQGLLPAEGGGDKGSYRLMGIEAFARAAMVYAFFLAGVDIVRAAKLVLLLAEDDAVGSKAHNLWTLVDNQKRPKNTANWPFGPEAKTWNLDNAYWLHRALTQHSRFYRAGKALTHDHVIEVFDRSMVYHCNLLRKSGSKDRLEPSQTTGGSLLAILEDWGRGQDLTVNRVRPMAIPASEELQNWLKHRSHACGIVSANLSLSIRNALDRLANVRKK